MKKIILLAASSFVLITSCKKGDTGPAGSTGPAGPSLTGNLSGHVFLYDQYGSQIFTGLSNSTVSIDNTTKTTLTDSTGKYIFSGLSTGSYTISSSLGSYGMMKGQDIQLTGNGDNNRDLKMSAIPTFSISVVTAVDTIQNGNNYVKVRGSIPADIHQRKVAIFASASSAVSSAPANYLLNYSATINNNNSNFSVLVPANDLYDAGMSSGGTVYFAIYPAAFGYNTSSTYEDFNTGRSFFTALGATASTASALVP